MISSSGPPFPKSVIVNAVYFYLRSRVSHWNLDEILDEHGVAVDYAPLNRWVVKYAPSVTLAVKQCKTPTVVSCLHRHRPIQASQLHHRAVASVYQTQYTSDVGVQKRCVSGCNAGWYRSAQHVPQRPTGFFGLWLSTICRTRWIVVSNGALAANTFQLCDRTK